MNAATPQLAQDPEALVHESRTRVRSRLAGRDRVVSLALTTLFLAGSVAFALLYDSHRSPSAATVVLLVLVYAVASQVEFEVGAGRVVPTQLVLVPMLFLLPLELVPLYVALALIVAHIPDFLLGRRHPARAFVLVGSARHAIGPALVLIAVADNGPTLTDWPWYLAALAAQFAIDAVGFTLREWLITGLPPKVEAVAVLSAFGVDAALAPIGFLAALAAVEDTERFLLVVPLLALLAIFARQRRASIDQALELGSAYRGTAFLLADLIEAKDSYTGSHSRQVVELVLAVADELGLGSAERRQAELAALLHDVGKMWVPGELIGKVGNLTPDERKLVNAHTIEGQRMLARVGGAMEDIGTIVRSCHERWDGRGYPDGLAGEQIPLVARIVAACDAYSAMTTNRPYHRAVPDAHGILELRKSAGTQFDPEVVTALVRVLAK